MKIAIVTYGLYIGGVEIAIKTLYQELEKLNHSVDIIEVEAKGSESENFKSMGFNVKSILIKPFETQNSYAKRLSNELNRYDVILLNSVPFVNYILGLFKKEIVVLELLHNQSQESYKELFINKEQWDRVVCVSYALEKAIKQRGEIEDYRVVTIPTGVNVLPNFPKKIDRDEKRFTILYVGRIDDKSKGVLLLPKIIKRVKESVDKEFILKVVGDGPSKRNLEKEIEKYALSSTILMVGALEHERVIDLMKEADLLIMPSYTEGQGIVYFEAMAQGLIPLVSNLKNNTDIYIQDGKNGFLCDIGDIECFAKKIIYMINNKDKILLLSKEAYKSAKESFSSEVMVKKYLQTIEEVKQNRDTIRTNRLEKIPFGDIPYILCRFIHHFIQVKNYIYRKIKG